MITRNLVKDKFPKSYRYCETLTVLIFVFNDTVFGLTGSLVALCWLFAFFEPFGLRLRNSVMRYYYPGRARVRSIWLYNHILRGRLSFLKYARRELKQKFGGKQEHITFKEYLRAHTR